MKNIPKAGLLTLSIFSFSISCNDSRVETSYLRQKNTELQSQVDSLNKTILSLREELDRQTAKHPPKNKKKINKTAPQSENRLPPPQRSESYTSSSQKTPSSSYNSYSGRCLATTRRGTQCKRTARSNGYCWQHGG